MKIFQSILCIMLLGISVASWGQEKKAYRLFDANGKEVGYREMIGSRQSVGFGRICRKIDIF